MPKTTRIIISHLIDQRDLDSLEQGAAQEQILNPEIKHSQYHDK
jgi:hypothetical protein